MIQTLKFYLFKNGYLLIIAAWLYTFSFIFSTSYFSITPHKIKSEIEDYLIKNEKTFDRFSNDSLLIADIIIENEDTVKSSTYSNSDAGLYVFVCNNVGTFNILYWNNNKVLPSENDLLKADGHYFIHHLNGQFEFIKKTFLFHERQVVTVAMIPVYWDYFFQNTYLKPNFPSIANLEKKYEINNDSAEIKINGYNGKYLFGLQKKSRIMPEGIGIFSFCFRVLGILFFFIFLNGYAHDVAQKNGWVKGFLFLIISIFSLRLISYFSSFPIDLKGLALFDNLIYASNALHPSLGDLLINILLVFWLASFIKKISSERFKNINKISGKKGRILSIFLSVLLIIIAFVCAGVTRSLIKDSSISYEVTNFFSLNIYTFVSFIILCFIILSFFYLSHVILLFIYKAVDEPVYTRYITIAVCGLLYLTLFIDKPATTSNVVVLVWLLLYLLIIDFRKDDILIPIIRSSFFIIWLIFFAASISALIIYQNDIKSLEKGRKTAESIAWDADPTIQNLMKASIVEIDSTFLTSNFARLCIEPSNQVIKDSLSKSYFSANFNKYDTKIYTFNQRFQPMYNDDTATYFQLRNIILTKSKATFHPDLFYYEKEAGNFSFIYEKVITKKDGGNYGYFFVLVEPKKYKGQTIYPELLKTQDDVEADLDVIFAIYNKGKLVKSNGDFNFLSHLPLDKLNKQDFTVLDEGDYREFWYHADTNKLVIIIEKGTFFVQFITLFAYLFGLFLSIIVFFQVGRLVIISKFRIQNLRHLLKLNIRRQIQGAIIFISLFSFIIIGVATIMFYINRFRQTNRERLGKAIQILGNELEGQIYAKALYKDGLGIKEKETNDVLNKIMMDVSEVHSLDANLYDVDGKLQASTQPEIYNRQLLSYMMEPTAYYHLHFKNEIQYIQEEKVSNFAFTSIYIPLNDDRGKIFAYLNIPYLNTQKELNQEISNFLVTLINLNAFIFVIAGAISVLLTNKITKSFSLIAGKMQEVNLGKDIEEIQWNSNDEIGALVKEYNKMVKKLEESALALAKSEREGAWREMARQVAHEIKNPLTPMKLSIQYLQRAIYEKNPDMEKLSHNVTVTLVEQIDQLAKIASDFSQFANIGIAKMEKFDLNELISSLINLYTTNQRVIIYFQHPARKAFIYADKTQINRLFTNLLQNAIEASDNAEKININIVETIENNKLFIQVTDHGGGIPADKQDKIFTPNFTTKTSGTGLGLAISKGIVEKANGRIWFTTEENVGTTFHILLPYVGLPV